MLEDPRARRFSEEFSRQWLRLDRRPLFRPSLESRELVEDEQRLASAHQQVARFLARQLAAGRPVTELLTASDPDPGGLLTSRALLSTISTPIRGGGDENWLGRGLVVQSSFLCRTFPLAAVYPYDSWEKHPLLDPTLTAASPRPGEPGLLSIRTTDKPCRECHRQLETIGAALDGFDGLGEPRSTQPHAAVDLAGESIIGPRALAAWILDSGRFEPCVAQKLLTYVLGRAVLPARRPADRCLVRKLTGGTNGSLRTWLWQGLTSAEFRAQGPEVIRDAPTPSPNSDGYTASLTPLPVSDAECASFDAATFLVGNCGTSACHGPGATTPVFAVADSETAAHFLRKATPAAGGYCGSYSGYVDPENPSQSLVIRKLTSGKGICGAPMPIAGGPRSLNAVEHACFIRWVEALARAPE
jgi:hypothetical protein